MTSFLPKLSRDNISYETIPIAYLLALGPRFYSRAQYYFATNKDFDPSHPRNFSKQISEDPGCDAQLRGRLVRAEAAVANGFETLGFFAAAVTAGNAARLSPRLMNGLSLGYVLGRLLYNPLYIYGDTKPLAMGRTAAWLSGIAICLTMFLQAGNKMRSSVL